MLFERRKTIEERKNRVSVFGVIFGTIRMSDGAIGYIEKHTNGNDLQD